MHSKFYSFLLPFLLGAALLSAQVPKDATIPVTATFTTGPASVTISWPSPTAASVVILRHTKISAPNLWTSLLNVSNNTQTTFVDNLVTAGQTYEYLVQRTVGGVTSYGYAHVAINAPVVDNRGKIIFFVDSLLMGPLANEVGQLKLDMMGDGWTVIPHIIGNGATVQTIKNHIISDYNTDPFNVRMVFLLGALPVPYSGNKDWDKHLDHKGAWPADSYYGDVNGVWTDATVNNIGAARAANDNVPGDKKFDQDIIPSAVELAVGRVDFRRLTPATFGTSQVELYRRYLNKNHAWRLKAYTVTNKALVDDNLGYASGEAFAADGYRNAYPLVGAANVVEADFFTSANADSYLLGYAAGPGTYTSASGVGTSTNFATNTVNVAFSLFFGDYFGDWDSETDPFLPSALASRGGILTSAWAGRPHVFYQGLASGETVGYCTQETQNAQYNTGFLPSEGESGVHISLLGDPTLRAHVVAPPTNLQATGQCGTVTLNWTASTGGASGGYQVYRALQRNGIYDRLTNDAVTGTSFADNNAPGDTLYYQVRAVQQVTTPGGGSYANTSTGATTFLIFTPSGVPTANLTGGTLTCTNLSVTLGGVNAPNTAVWTGPNGFTSTQLNPVVTLSGAYAATVTAPNGCTAMSEVAVLIDTFLPVVTVPAFPPLSCSMPCGIITLPATPGYLVRLDGTLLQTGVPYSVCDTGLHTVVIQSIANGCEDTYTATVYRNITPPGATASSTASCSPPFQLQGSSPTSGATFIWSGPDEFSSAEQNPLVTAPGTYLLIVSNPVNGCTSTALVNVSAAGAPTASATGAMLQCGQATATIQGSSTAPGATFAWTGPGGFTSNQQNPTVTLAGTYVLTVTTPNGCTNTANAVVSQDAALPTATATGAAVSCGQVSATIQGNSTTPGVTFAWTGPGGFTSSQQNPSVTLTGTYVLTVTAPNGCSNTASAVVSLSGALPNVSASGAILSCSQLSVIILGNSTTLGVTFVWTGPGGFTSSQQNPSVTLPGTYTLTVTAPNGCSSTANAVVSLNAVLPNATASGATLNCGQVTTTIQGNSTSLGVVFAWSGPGGFTSTQQNPTVTLPGTYTLTVTAPNGCTNTASAVVVLNTGLPNISAIGATLACNQMTATIQGNSTTSGATFSWTGPGGFTSTQSNPTITATGIYILTVTDPNGCTATASAVVNTDSSVPNVTASGTTLTCAQPTTELPIQGNSTTLGVTYAWTGPNGFTSTLKNPPATLPGTYVLVVTAPNGCTNSATAVLSLDTSIPNANAIGAILTCSQTTVTIQASSTTPGVNFAWAGPGGFTSTQTNPTVTLAGTYVLTVTAPNGCTSTASAIVSANTTAPTATATSSGALLTCNQPTATIQGNSTTSGATFAWTGPGGFTSTQQNPTVTLAGTYVLTVTAPNGCTSTSSTVVSLDVTAPNAVANGATLTCNQLTAIIQGSSTTPGVTFAWTGPGGFISTQQNPGVTLPGTYTLTVTGTNGCISTASATVVTSITLPIITAIGTTLTCSQPTGVIQGTSITSGSSFVWTGPGGFTSTQANPTVGLSGVYILTVTAANGCSNTATAIVNVDASVPNITASGTTLTCSQPAGILQGNSTTPGATYAWTGPNGFMSTQQNPGIAAAGIYILQVTVPNGCSVSTSVEVLLDMGMPTIFVPQPALLNCNTPCVTVQATSTTPGTVAFMQEYCLPGTYTATLTAPNGCTNSQSFEVVQAPVLQLDVAEATVDCEGISTISATATGGTPPYHYQWSTGDTMATIMVLPGLAEVVDVTVTDAGGCNIPSLSVIIPPFSPIVVSTMVVAESAAGAQNGSIALSVQGGDCPVYNYVWSNGATTSAIVNLPGGTYTATVTCELTGCTAVITGTVQTTVGTEDAAFWKKLGLAPNPANDEALLSVQFPTATALQVKILDATGRIVLNLPETTLLEGSIPLDLQRCPPGMYTVLLSTKNEMAVRKLAVIR